MHIRILESRTARPFATGPSRAACAPARAVVLCVLASILAGCVSTEQLRVDRARTFTDAILQHDVPFLVPPGTKVDSVLVDDTTTTVRFFLSKEFAYRPFRPESVDTIYMALREMFGDLYRGYRFIVVSLGTPIEELVPNYYRTDPSKIDVRRLPKTPFPFHEPVVLNISQPAFPSRGLQNRNLLVWHSHGWYYNATAQRWEWQRPRLFQSVEDLGPLSFTIPYLIPMLEHAGARVFVPRERDTQTMEVLVDNDSAQSGYAEAHTSPNQGWRTSSPGFAPALSYPPNVNPFLQGTSRWTTTDRDGSARVRWTPDIPRSGMYTVSVSYAATDSSAADARYTVYHSGGSTSFRVNQRVGGGTWHLLGTFGFRMGKHADSGSVVLTSTSAIPNLHVSADAVKFGGGMGIVERNGATSGRPRFMEGARYYLQFAGMPDTLVYSLNNNMNDYRDDYQSRAEYGNYLTGAPFGPNPDRSVKGLGIPIDLSLAFHTDAGITSGDTAIGTLLIYSVEGYDSARVFPDGTSRLANRDLADLMQTQIVNDIRLLYDPAWKRRELRNADYSEAVRPNFPGVLLELLSHQNFFDSRFMLDPAFRFDVARAIYKSILRFLADPAHSRTVVQPLPVSHLSAELMPGGDVHLRWRPVPDPLEPTAVPDRYAVYTREEDEGFDNGQLVDAPTFVVRNISPGTVYSFRVSALNDGGESMPSEVVSVCRMSSGKPTVLIVNAFDRIAPPACATAPGFSGFFNLTDAGVPDRIDYNFPGLQYDFRPDSPFRSNDSPGHGASFADDETRLIAGNTFDFPIVHGWALRDLGYSFASCSDEAVMDTLVDLGRYACVDLLMGEERATPRVRPDLDTILGLRFVAFPLALRNAVGAFTQAGGALMVSGSHMGVDLWSTLPADSTGMRFAREVLKFSWVGDHASRTGRVITSDTAFLPQGVTLVFSTELNDSIYAVESPESLAPVRGGTTLLRYEENLFSAAVGVNDGSRIVVLGFPFETILDHRGRTALMRSMMAYLKVR